MKRSSVRRKRLGPPRRGRVRDEKYMAWLAHQPGVIFGGRIVTIHHHRFCGSPKNDRQTLPIEWGYHTVQEGPTSIDALGKAKWEALHGVSIDAEITRYQSQYLLQHPGVKW